MKKQSLWMTIPVTTAVLLALAGCGGPDSNQASTGGQPSATTGSEQTQSGSGSSASSDTGENGTKTNTATNASSASSGKDGTANSNTSGSTTHSELSDVDEVVKAVRSELKNQSVSLPTSFPLPKGKYLGAAITTNTIDASHVNFYTVNKPLALNDPSLTNSNSKMPWLASYEVKTYENPNQTDVFPETDLQNIPKDMSVDLGHGIKGMVEGAAGSQYLTWQEGRWTLQIRSVSEDQMNNPGIAKKMVEYLESHMLPAPKDKGFVDVQYASGGKSVRVTISWQDGKQIHQLKTDQVPLDALGMVVSVK
ncbi:hypothetical protein Q9R46_08125 [Paenibacillus sp. RRE4]|uniref:hypothetical protein n=1 Tax=Paenibacillus sp. RRE4 TaxID=2962587 RepID=UPI002881D76E|nr:hypothetical protein [Paenibacillus sp. RRE4]MDT0122603.1 hypothetical protein [Paenibacillus sp. RRE4]